LNKIDSVRTTDIICETRLKSEGEEEIIALVNNSIK
jgi:hypothetical protein